MDDFRVGRICRALRRRRKWRQLDLARRAGCHQTTISAIERGHAADLTLGTVRRVFAALDASFDGIVGWRAGDLDRLLDERHAGVVEAVIRALTELGWSVMAEATYSEFGERGSIDVFAYRSDKRAVAIFEIKTDIAGIEVTVRKHDEKVRLVVDRLGRRWLGWQPRCVGRVLACPEDRAIRRRVDNHQATFATAYPRRAAAIRSWLREPFGNIGGIWFLTPNATRLGSHGRGGPRRVRTPRIEAALPSLGQSQHESAVRRGVMAIETDLGT